MNTEITKIRDVKGARGWIFYDAACALCVRGRRRAGRLFESRGFQWFPLQTPGAAARLGVAESAFESRLHLLETDGRVLHNADAFGVLCRSVWWLCPLGLLMLVPGFRELGRVTYDWFARNRYCIGGICRVDKAGGSVGFVDYSVAFLLPAFAGFAFWRQPPWVLMWALVFGLGLGLKWLTWWHAIVHGARPSATRAFAWFTLWPGMDSRAFFIGDGAKRPEFCEWLWAGGMTVLGAVLIWVVVAPLLLWNTMGGAWAGMLGIVVFLHFGVIRLLSLLLRQFGLSAAPIMNAPVRASSLAEFWGARWNTAFSIPARRMALLPLARRIGLPAAGWIVFLMSGLIHEVVISLPARAGFGLPTLYFVVQGAGVAIERSRAGRRWGIGAGHKGRLFMLFFTVGPLFWLFHPAFAVRVIVPFLNFLNHS